MRLQKFLARAGVASRRASEDIIAQGRVRVDGQVVTQPGTRVDATRQIVEVDGLRVSVQAARWIMLHKPPGSMCTRGDPRGRPTIYDLLPDDAASLFHVGRLDYMSEGLLLLTNDGDLANALLHPSARLRRRYVVTLVGPVPPDITTRLVQGVELEDGPAAAEQARWDTPPQTSAPRLELTLLEGRNREIRRIIGVLDLKIRTLERTSFGPLELGGLAPGSARDLTAGEVRMLHTAAARVPA
ncbi:MAG: pseudouridine synthase [Gemmatimonadota bacterium]